VTTPGKTITKPNKTVTATVTQTKDGHHLVDIDRYYAGGPAKLQRGGHAEPGHNPRGESVAAEVVVRRV
jgi:hypothetical protein